jgi:hypothetical protein
LASQRGDTTRPAAAADEARLADDADQFEISPNYTVTLRNGATEDLTQAMATWDTLTQIKDNQPALFAAALALAQGQEPSPSMRRELRRGLLTLRNGVLRPAVKNVLLSSYEETPEGPVLVNPIKPTCDADRRAFEELEARSERNFRRFLDFDDPSPGRG